MIITRSGTYSLKIFVTGGAGFIGRHLVDFLLQNHEVTIFDNLSNSSESDIELVLTEGVNFQFGDILDYPTLQKFSKGFDMIIHLAAQSDVAESIQNAEFTYEVNVKGTKNILKCCKENNIEKLVFASSAAVYGDSDFAVNESTFPNPLSPYGKSKLDAEKEIIKFSKENKIDAISLRMFNVYDLQDGKQPGVIPKFIRNVSDGKQIVINGDGEQTRDFIFIDDVVSAFNCAIKNIAGKRGTTYNIATGKSVSIKEVAKLIVQSSGKETKITHQDSVKGDIKSSQTSVDLAKKDLKFVAKHNVLDDLTKIFKS